MLHVEYATINHAQIIGQSVFSAQIEVPYLLLTQVDITGHGLGVIVALIAGGDKVGETQLAYGLGRRGTQLLAVTEVIAQIQLGLKEIEIALIVDITRLGNF